jgi:hypothetical protein
MTAWIEYVQVGDILGVESVCGRSRAEANRNTLAGPQVHTAQTYRCVGLAAAVDAWPNFYQLPARDPGVKLTSRQKREQLSRRGHITLSLE